jgi:SAM-dependent methyltransferase
MDSAWDDCVCGAVPSADELHKYYSHPVWLLNGLFIEQDRDSIANREAFSGFVARLAPTRVADVGGGFGTLARMVGARCEDAAVEVMEPNPHEYAVRLARMTKNVRYVPGLSGEYDVLIATDVFEHVHDPLRLVEQTASHLRVGGIYLIANCFWPVIRCHLEATFHFRWSWDTALAAMNLQPETFVAYGRAFRKKGPVDRRHARSIERRSRLAFGLIERLPGRVRSRAARVLVEGRL